MPFVFESFPLIFIQHARKRLECWDEIIQEAMLYRSLIEQFANTWQKWTKASHSLNTPCGHFPISALHPQMRSLVYHYERPLVGASRRSAKLGFLRRCLYFAKNRILLVFAPQKFRAEGILHSSFPGFERSAIYNTRKAYCI